MSFKNPVVFLLVEATGELQVVYSLREDQSGGVLAFGKTPGSTRFAYNSC